MIDPQRGSARSMRGRGAAVLAGVVILMLAVGALLFPAHRTMGSHAVMLVLDPGCVPPREASLYVPLGRFIEEIGGQAVEVRVVKNLAEFQEDLLDEPEILLCPDGVGMTLQGEKYLPLVVGRRAAPQNLRPRSVLVYRKSAGLVQSPWVRRPQATVIGDSLSLAGTGPWRRHEPLPAPQDGGLGPAFGPDPYDHSPVLHALRLGCFDYAVVRQWDAERFLTAGLLSPLEWGVEILSPPVPDMMILVSRKVSTRRRLALGDHLSSLGRSPELDDLRGRDLVAGLAQLRLVGFNLLVEPDLDLVRRNFPGSWPPALR